VSFIELVCQEGDKAVKEAGTGFFVWYPDERAGKDSGFTYLVTNRHVAECWDETRHPMLVKSVSVRVNLVDGSSTVLPLNTKGNVPWIFPPDESVDLALIPLAPDRNKVDYMTIPISSFVTDDVITSLGITEGAKIMFTGFFYQFQGERRMQPIIREGILAMMPDENLVTTTGKSGTVYLGDVHIFGGNSGSPVFVDLGGFHGNIMRVGEDYRVLGIVSGMFYEDEDFTLRVTTTVKGTAHANSGIAMIVPPKFLKNMLESPSVQALRDSEIASWKKSH